MKLIENFRLSSTNAKIDEKLFNEILIIVIIVSITNIIANIIISFPFEANYKWAFMIVLSYITNHNKYKSSWFKFGYILFIVLVILPLGWYQSGIDSYSAIAYIFLIIIAITFLFKGKQRLFFISLISLLFVTFIYIKYTYPSFLPTYDSSINLVDQLIQILLAIFISFLMLKQFDMSYIENANKLIKVNRELEVFAYTDSLTGIHNRAFIFQKFNEAIKSKQSFTTVIIDIDNFKHINDNHGHIVGDVVLNNFATLLAKQFSDYGYVARYGGDEFIMLLNISSKELLEKMSSLSSQFEKQNTSVNYNVTYSAGYGLYQYQPLNEHLKEVDTALYSAKRNGKGKIQSI